MAEITDEELAELRHAQAELGQRKAADEAAAAAADKAPDAPPEPTHRAILADGSTHEYAGAHPTHVTREGEDREIPVLTVHPLA